MIDIDGRPRVSRRSAEQAIESLRKGIPPTGLVRQFTVGRQAELDELATSLARPTQNRGSALLIRANYGAGKSHLLQVIREMALQAGYAVGSVTVDSQSGVRFNRMDTILGAICRSVEVPGQSRSGIGALLDHFADADESALDDSVMAVRAHISDGGAWGFSERLGAPAMFVALRAWVTSSASSRTRDVVTDWLSFTDQYRNQRKKLYQELVAFRGRPFRDPREDWQFYADDVFSLHTQGYDQCWRVLADLELIAESSGLKGVILLFDEFEDVIQNLNNHSYQQAAFFNLFRFFAGDRFPGMAYFAVTPEFIVKCKQELVSRYVYEFPFERFDSLPHFEMSRIRQTDFKALAHRIRELHGAAYGWNAVGALGDGALGRLVDKLLQRSSQDQIRQAIEGFVEALDDRLQTEDG
jgi:hypothetical protein